MQILFIFLTVKTVLQNVKYFMRYKPKTIVHQKRHYKSKQLYLCRFALFRIEGLYGYHSYLVHLRRFQKYKFYQDQINTF